MNNLISLQYLSKSFGNQKVINNFSYDFPSKGLIILKGQSGSGKTTLLNIISGLDTNFNGKCYILNKNILNFTIDERLKNLGYVFQDFCLLENDTVKNNLLITIDTISSSDKKVRDNKVHDLLNFVGLRKKEKKLASTLSGGEKQRICIARALSTNPKILLCDEPTGSLDETNANKIFGTLKSISKSKLVVVATHDEELASKYGDEVIEFKDGEIITYKNDKQIDSESRYVSLKIEKKRNKLNLSERFLISHTFNTVKKKKWRTIFCCSAISIGLIGVGLSNYVSTCISTQVSNVFDSIIPSNQIVMSLKNPSTNYINHIYSANKSSINKLIKDYPEEIKDFGVSYSNNFEEIFKDENKLYTLKSSKTVVLPSFSARTANDFLWVDDYENLNYYPSKIDELENDEIILGLPYSDMVNLCYGLQILRNFESLGDYIHDKGLQMIFSFAHYEWQYEDEQIFNVRAVVAFSKPTIFHSNHQWNEWLFEESMRFPSNDYDDSSLPWILNKVYYLETKGEISSLVHSIRENKKYDSFLFEPPNYLYESTHCFYGETCSLKRIYVYQADKNTVSYSDIQKAFKTPGIKSKVVTTTNSYFAFPTSLAIGFSNMFFLSDNLESSNQIIDSYSTVKKEASFLTYSLPKNTVDGNYLKTAGGGLRISSDLDNIFEGRKPIGLEECVLSSSLKDSWDIKDEIFVTAQIGESEVGDYIQRDFRIGRLKVVGYIENNSDVLYVNDDWNIDYFRDYLGMSSFNLEPTGAIFTFDKKYDIDSLISNLSNKFQSYNFTNPSKEILKSIESTTDYISFILKGAALIAGSISILLFITVVVLSILENKKESIFFNKIGINSSNISKQFQYQILFYLSVSGLIAISSICLSEIITQFYIGNSFGIKVRNIQFDTSPILIILCIILATYFIFSSFIRLYFLKKLKKSKNC